MSEIKRNTEMFYSKTSASSQIYTRNSMQRQQNFAVNDGSKRDIDGRYCHAWDEIISATKQHVPAPGKPVIFFLANVLPDRDLDGGDTRPM